MSLDRHQVEKLDVLDGSRNADRRRAAIRIEDIAPLLELRPTLRAAKAAGAAPTAAEYNALVADLVDMHARLKAVVLAIQARL